MEITLRVSGIDIDNDETFDVIAENFPEFLWETNNDIVLVTLFVNRDDSATQVLSIVRRMDSLLPGIRVDGVFRDLVSTTDISLRTDVSREGARKWSQASDFPSAWTSVGPKAMKLWLWSEVVAWLKEERDFEVDCDLATASEMTHVENCLMRNPDYTTVKWHQVVQSKKPAPLFQPIRKAARVSSGGSPFGSEVQNFVSVKVAARVEA